MGYESVRDGMEGKCRIRSCYGIARHGVWEVLYFMGLRA